MGDLTAGVSVVICGHNSATRLPETLAHLARQQVPEDLAWEVLVVDNASTDGTAQAASACWPSLCAAPIRIVHEARLGLSHARIRGIHEARHETISFVDDDNWVSPDWVQTVARVMREHPEAGACGGPSEPVFERDPPAWFAAHAASYAAGEQAARRGWRPQLWGTGISIRKSAWRELENAGFEFMLMGRKGGELTAGEDSELCLAMTRAGWKLWYEPDLRVRHFIPASRLRWDHLRKLYRGFGAARVYLPLYEGWWEENDYSRTAHRSWLGRLLFSLRDLYGKRQYLLSGGTDGDPEVLYADWSVGFFQALFAEAFAYPAKARGIRQGNRETRRPL